MLIQSVAPKFQGQNFHLNKAIVTSIQALAQRKNCTTAQIALAWVAAQGFIAIPGTTKEARLMENLGSREVQLTREDLMEMRELVDGAKVVGERYGEKHKAWVGH
jgi:aryl-alcohol dehydrogenase-like predicted oxidoreductase